MKVLRNLVHPESLENLANSQKVNLASPGNLANSVNLELSDGNLIKLFENLEILNI